MQVSLTERNTPKCSSHQIFKVKERQIAALIIQRSLASGSRSPNFTTCLPLHGKFNTESYYPISKFYLQSNEVNNNSNPQVHFPTLFLGIEKHHRAALVRTSNSTTPISLASPLTGCAPMRIESVASVMTEERSDRCATGITNKRTYYYFLKSHLPTDGRKKIETSPDDMINHSF